MPAAAKPYRVEGDGIRLSVRVTPKAGADAIGGLYRTDDGSVSLKLRVRAQPEKGKANKAVISLLAKALRCARSNLEVTAGLKDRTKTVVIGGEAADLARRLDDLIDDGASDD
ncbi:MAG: DUF167 family protein [Hyphomicrobiales bacterium]